MITLFTFRGLQPYRIEFYKITMGDCKNPVMVDCVNTEELDMSKPDDAAKYDDVWLKYRDQSFAEFNVKRTSRGILQRFYYYAPADK